MILLMVFAAICQMALAIYAILRDSQKSPRDLFREHPVLIGVMLVGAVGVAAVNPVLAHKGEKAQEAELGQLEKRLTGKTNELVQLQKECNEAGAATQFRVKNVEDLAGLTTQLVLHMSTTIIDLQVAGEYRRYDSFRQGLLCYYLRRYQAYYDWLREARVHFQSQIDGLKRIVDEPQKKQMALKASRYNLALVLAARHAAASGPDVTRQADLERARGLLDAIDLAEVGPETRHRLQTWRQALAASRTPTDEGCWWPWQFPTRPWWGELAKSEHACEK